MAIRHVASPALTMCYHHDFLHAEFVYSDNKTTHYQTLEVDFRFLLILTKKIKGESNFE